MSFEPVHASCAVQSPSETSDPKGAFKVVGLFRGSARLAAWCDTQTEAIEIAQRIVGRGLPASVHSADGLPVWSPCDTESRDTCVSI